MDSGAVGVDVARIKDRTEGSRMRRLRTMTEIWMLCVVLDWRSPTQASCMVRPDEASCHDSLVEWVHRAFEWEERVGVRGLAFGMCEPALEST